MPETSDPYERWLYGGVMASLIGSAWASLGLIGASVYAPYLSHDFLAESNDLGRVLARMAIFLGGWTLMSIAMMLPSSLPLVTVFHTITSGRWRLVLLLVVGYLWIWGIFGLGTLVLDAGLHAVAERSRWLDQHPHVIPGALLLTAGLFQFSPLKHSCLERCRSPIGFVIQHWSGGQREVHAFMLGVHHGIFCVGCCWGLMLLMFGAGAVNLGWMLVLAAVMFLEKAVSWGRCFTAPVGVLLTLWGLALFLRLPGVPAPF